jgi:CMP-N,N'-diacetyllegionaminic acid synthase
MNVIAVIPARGSSKGIPRKNTLNIGGKPLMVWSIEAAQGCPSISRIIVSSDDDEILSVAETYGAEALKRPPEIATDTTRSEPVLMHALEHVKSTGELPTWAAYLQPTSPLRTAQNLDRALALLEEKHADGLISVVEGDKKILKAYLADEQGFLHGVANDDYPNWNRQDLPPVYMPNGAIYFVKSEQFLRTPKFWNEKTIPFVMSAEESIDLDTPEDIERIEVVLSSRVLQ